MHLLHRAVSHRKISADERFIAVWEVMLRMRENNDLARINNTIIHSLNSTPHSHSRHRPQFFMYHSNQEQNYYYCFFPNESGCIIYDSSAALAWQPLVHFRYLLAVTLSCPGITRIYSKMQRVFHSYTQNLIVTSIWLRPTHTIQALWFLPPRHSKSPHHSKCPGHAR